MKIKRKTTILANKVSKCVVYVLIIECFGDFLRAFSQIDASFVRK